MKQAAIAVAKRRSAALRGPPVRQCMQRFKKRQRLAVNARTLALAWPRNVQNRNRMRGEPLAHASSFRRKAVRIQRHHACGFVRAFGELQSDKASVGKFAEVENQRGVTVGNIAARALAVIPRSGFAQLVARVEHAVFGAATKRTPATVRNAMRDREVQRRAIGAGLSAGDDGEGYGQLIAKVTNPDIEPKAFRPANLVNLLMPTEN